MEGYLDGGDSILACIYGSPSPQHRNKLWDDLGQDQRRIRGPWMAIGDFNSITSIDEVSNQETFVASRCSRFNEWLENEGMVDIGFSGPTFTWTRGNSVESFKGARLDRAVCSPDWLDTLQGTQVFHVSSSYSDHLPVCVRLEPVRGEQ